MAIYNATFQIDQDGVGTGTPGISRRDLWLTKLIHLIPTSPPPGATFKWEFLDKPVTSTVEFLDETSGLPSDTSELVKFTPDVWGTYRIRLTINNGQYISILLAAVILDSSGGTLKRGWRYASFKEIDTEGNFTGQTRGYADDFDYILDDILLNAFGVGEGAVDDLTALGLVDATSLTDGVIFGVHSVLDEFQLDKSSGLTPDGITVIAANGGGGNWVRRELSSAAWRAQTTWYVDPSSGDDENVGSVGAPIKTMAEWRRRHGRVLGAGAAVTINLVGVAGVFAGDIYLDCFIDQGESLTITGASTDIDTGSISGIQVWSTVLRDEVQLSDASIAVSWTASGLVGHAIVTTSGTYSGARGFVVSDLGTKTARSHRFYLEGTGFVEPSVSDNYKVVDLLQLTGDIVVDTRSRPVEFRNLYIDPTSPSTLQVVSGGIQAYSCKIDTSRWEQNDTPWYLYGCLLVGAGDGVEGRGYLEGCAFSACSFLVQGGFTSVSVESVFDDSSLVLSEHAYVFLGDDCAFFDRTSAPVVTVGPTCTLDVDAAVGAWGTGNASSYATYVAADGTLRVTSTSIWDIDGGTTEDAKIGGKDSTNTEVLAGVVDLSTMAKAVVE